MTLNMSMRLVVFVWLTLQTCEGSIRCFECTDTFKPYFCDTVTLCADSEECFVDQFVTSGGEVLFNSGCRSKQRCDVHRKRGVVGVSSDVINDALPEDSSTDILTCQNCCNDTNYCNNKGCNEAPPERSQRGPLCFECTNQNSHGCRHVTRCDLNFACEIVKKEVDNFTLYDSGCVHVTPTTVCNITYGAQYSQQVALVGKREATHDNCPKCCDWDFCNDACTGQEAVGGFTNWESWSPCPNTCGGAGNQFRMRTCTVQRCVGALYEHRSCGYQTPCPIDGGFSTWGFWSGCTTTCGGHGTQSRHRSCTNPAPAFGGNTCKGFFDEVIPCGNTTCPSATSIYDTWTQWSACSVSCGPAGHQRRQKLCFTANHVLNESLCKQPLWETRACNQNVTCPAVDGVWKEWSVWGACSVTCGSGIKERTRVCEPPRNGGHYCIGDNTERDVCHRDQCPVTDVYTDWGPWGPCTVSCGKHGNQIRTRTCQSTSCDGDTSSLTETKLCQHLHHCVVDGGWGAWQSWGRCSVTCGDGHRFRSRTCNHPTPRNGGDPCHGNSRQSSPCHIDCPAEVCEQAGYEMQPWNLNGYRTVVMCDRIYTTPDTWSSARQTCKRNGADLLTFSSSDSSLNHMFPRLMDATNLQRLYVTNFDDVAMTDNDVIHKEIHQALHEGELITVNMLLKDPDVDVDFRDVTHDLQTLLMKLCYVNMDITSLKLIIETIFEKSPDVNIQDSWGRTVLMHACIANRPIIIESLLEFDQTDVGLTDFDGNSALSFAVQNCDVFTLEDILQHPSGARLLTVHNSKGQTPVTIAEKSGDKSVMRLFQSYVDKTVGLQQKKKNRNQRHRDVIKLTSSTKPRQSTERQSVSSAPPESSSKSKDNHKLFGRPTLDITVATSQSGEVHAHEKCDSAPVTRSYPNAFDNKTHIAVTSLSLSSPRLQRRHHKQNSLLEECFKRNNANLLPPMHTTSGGSGIDLTDRDLLLPEHSIRRQRRPSISLPDLRSVAGFLVTSGSSTPRSDAGDDAEESSCHIPTSLITINDEIGNDDDVFNNTFPSTRNRLHKTSSKQSLCDVTLPDIHRGGTKRNDSNYGKKGFQPLNRQRKFSSSDDQLHRTLTVNDNG